MHELSTLLACGLIADLTAVCRKGGRQADMKPLFVRELSEGERRALRAGLRSFSSFTVRRCQILLTSAESKMKPQEIAERLHCSDQCVREAIWAFRQEGLACLQEKSRAPHRTRAALDEAGLERLREMVRISPRVVGFDTSVWTLELLSEACFREGLTEKRVSIETIRRSLRKLGIVWSRAKKWIQSPDSRYGVKKNRGTDWSGGSEGDRIAFCSTKTSVGSADLPSPT